MNKETNNYIHVDTAKYRTKRLGPTLSSVFMFIIYVHAQSTFDSPMWECFFMTQPTKLFYYCFTG